MNGSRLNRQAGASRSFSRDALRVTALALALAGAFYVQRGHAQEMSPNDSGTTEVPEIIAPQPDSTPDLASPTDPSDENEADEEASAVAVSVLFEPGTAQITPEGTALLDEVLQAVASTVGGAVLLTGHTDSVESAAGANELSQARAVAVGTYLNRAGVPADRIIVRGVGNLAPTTAPSSCSNLDGEELAKCLAPDRSVDIEVVSFAAEDPSMSAGPAPTSRETN